MLTTVAALLLSSCVGLERGAGSQPENPPEAKSPAAPDQARLSALRTMAEQSDFHKTASYDEVNAYLKDLAAASPLIRLSDIGTSGESRKIPLALLADPPVANADEAKRSGKLIIAMLGGIHSGECDGKEALLALARDIAAAKAAASKSAAKETEKEKDQPAEPGDKTQDSGPKTQDLASLLDSCIFAFIPIYNPDGNEKLDPNNRRGQVGPDTMGKRENAAGLDLNRDFVKLDAPETRALLKFINQYDPHILIDTHTTNGSYHRYPLTYDTNKNPAGDAKLLEFARKTMLPEIAKAVKERHNLDTFWYGNFEKDHSVWESYPDEPRYGINYIGMRNRIGILTESYSYDTYKGRIDSQYKFLSESLAYAAAHKDQIKKLIGEADRRASSGPGSEAAANRGGPGRGRGGQRPPRGDGPPRGEPARAEAPPADGAAQPERPAPPRDEPRRVSIRSKPVTSDVKATILGFVEEQRDGRTRPTTEHKDYEVDLQVDFEAETTIERPFAYILPGSEASLPAVQTLQRHGIKVDELREDLTLDATISTIDAVTRASRPFQGHSLVAVKATASNAEHRIPAGSFIVRTAQPLGNLVSYLLEPTSADGLTTWNFFDDGLRIGEPFPVVRLEKLVPMTTLAAADLPEDRKPKQPITFDLVQNGDRPPNLGGSPVSISTWLDDEHFLQNKDGRLYKVHAATGRAERYYDPAPIAAALEKLPTLNRRDADGIANRGSFNWDKARAAFVFDFRNDLYYCKMDGSYACRLTSSPQREELWSLSPDGAFVAYVKENDLWVVDVATHTERALTTGGTDTLRNGKADWVYYEEIFSRGETTYWWSPDSTHIAYLQIDSSPIKVYTIVNDIPEGLVVENTRYPKVGQPNPTAKLFSVNIAGGTPTETSLQTYTPQDMLILNCGWRPDSSGFIAYISNRTQTWVDVLSCPADGGDPTKLFRETTQAWVEPAGPPRFLKDGSFLFESERTGWKHYYHYSKDGKLTAPLTSGEWEARSIVELDEENGYVYLSGTKDNLVADNLYRVKLDGTDLTRLTSEPGPHRTDVSPKGTYFTDSWSNPEQPARLVLRKTADQSIVRTLDTNPVRDLDRFILGDYQRIQITTPDNFILEASILKPANFNPAKKHPIWFQTYAGPHAPTVGDSWRRSSFDEYLANAGFIVLRADPRSASGKGAVATWTAYKQLGVPELADIETIIKSVCENPWVDASRIGMSGHSYGGFMTAYAMTHSKLFAAGIAGAPVTDWRDYDSVYTERMMGLPAENLEGYDKTSVVKAAKDLHGRLLILHGMIDDNVHPQNATRLMRALQRADKDFEVMLYPEARHGIGGKHYNRLMYEFIIRTLGEPKAAPAEGSPEPKTEPARTGP